MTTAQDLLLLSVAIALGFLFAVAFYESLSTRDVLVGWTMRLVRRRTHRAGVRGAAYLLTVGLGIPVLVASWTVVLELGLLVVSSADQVGDLAMISVSIVAAARILAYVRERTSHELAKAIPLAFTFALLTGDAGTRLGGNLARVLQDPQRSALTVEMVAFVVGLELSLRILTDGSHTVLASFRRRRGLESDLGAWRTLLAAIRRPVASSTATADREAS